MNLTSLRTAAVAAGAALLTCGALSLTQDAAVAVQQRAADSGLTLAGPTGEDTIEITRRGPSQIRAGEEFTYDLVLKNVSAEPIRGIRVTETTQGVELRGANDKAAQVEGNRLTFNAGQLAAGDSRTLKVTARASETGEARSCIVVDYDPALCTVYEVTKPDLKLVWTLYADREVEAQCDVAGVYSCDDVFIEYKVTNDGTGETEPIVLTHNLPEGLTYTGKQTVKATVDPLSAGETKSFKVPLELAETAAGQQLDLSAEAKAGGITASTDAQTVSILEPSLDVRVDGPAEQYLGRDATARVTVTNNSDAPALNTIVAVAAPEGARDVRFDTRDFDGKMLNVGCLMPGESRTYDATYRVEEAGEFDMTARASAYCVEDVEKTLTTTYKGISAILIEVVDKKDPVPVGETTTYEIYVKNQGSAPGLNVNLTGVLAAEQSFVSGTGDSEVSADGKNVSFGAIKELAPGDVVSWNLVVKADSAAKTRLKLQLKSDANDDPILEEEPTTLY